MYNWLLKHMGKRMATVIIVCWYLLLVLLIIFSAGWQQGRFRYLEW